MIIHLTVTGFNAGATLCGAPRHQDDAQYVHAMYAPAETLSSSALCRTCGHLWACESDACWASDHAAALA